MTARASSVVRGLGSAASQVGALALGLVLVACDAGSTTDPGEPGFVEGGITDDSWERPDSATPVEMHGLLSVVGSELRNQDGDVVQLKGVSSMWLNWENEGYAESAEGLTWLRDNWNLSVIRAAMGITPGGAYLSDPDGAKDQVRRIVDNAIAAGVYVIIDWHDHDATVNQAEAEAFFAEMATSYGDQPNVIYEPFNEPVDINWSTELKPYHEAVVAAIRAVDPDNVIVLGTPTYSQQVDAAAADPVDGENLMYTLHFYSCTHGSWLTQRATNAIAQGIALFVTEWGATNADGGLDGLVCEDEGAFWHDFLNQHRISWAAWKFDNCTPDSTCMLQPSAPLDGGWTNDLLRGHAFFVRDRMRLSE